MKIAIGCDHGGLEHKNAIIAHLKERGFEVVNFGTDTLDSVDYPDIAVKVCNAVVNHECERGILVCGTGIGISIAANRHKGIRAALLYSNETAALAREHNNANIAVFGARTQQKNDVLRYLETFLTTDFSNGERHNRRIAELG